MILIHKDTKKIFIPCNYTKKGNGFYKLLIKNGVSKVVSESIVSDLIPSDNSYYKINVPELSLGEYEYVLYSNDSILANGVLRVSDGDSVIIYDTTKTYKVFEG